MSGQTPRRKARGSFTMPGQTPRRKASETADMLLGPYRNTTPRADGSGRKERSAGHMGITERGPRNRGPKEMLFDRPHTVKGIMAEAERFEKRGGPPPPVESPRMNVGESDGRGGEGRVRAERGLPDSLVKQSTLVQPVDRQTWRGWTSGSGGAGEGGGGMLHSPVVRFRVPLPPGGGSLGGGAGDWLVGGVGGHWEERGVVGHHIASQGSQGGRSILEPTGSAGRGAAPRQEPISSPRQ
ncbi:hypothetical protein T484DRAFT_1878740, partial [Baffinella frigidus]